MQHRQPEPPSGKIPFPLILPLIAVLLAYIGPSLSAADDPKPSLSPEQAALGQLLYRNRREQVLLGRAVREFEAGRTTEGLLYLQEVLDAAQDGFLISDSGRRITTVRNAARKVLSQQSPEVIQTYERVYGYQARRMLNQAIRDNDPMPAREAGRRFFQTAAGFEAVDWLATRRFDQGLVAAAARDWDHLLEDPVHAKRVTTSLILKTAIAHQLCGRQSRSRELVQRIGDGRL